jgi:hypothetical protein
MPQTNIVQNLLLCAHWYELPSNMNSSKAVLGTCKLNERKEMYTAILHPPYERGRIIIN